MWWRWYPIILLKGNNMSKNEINNYLSETIMHPFSFIIQGFHEPKGDEMGEGER
jgi:hypothetical protein